MEAERSGRSFFIIVIIAMTNVMNDHDHCDVRMRILTMVMMIKVMMDDETNLENNEEKNIEEGSKTGEEKL